MRAGRGNFEIKKEDFNKAVDKMKQEIDKNGISIKKILCEPCNIGPACIRNSIDFTADYIIEFLFLGEKDGTQAIYNCHGYAFGMISEYVMDRPGAYPEPKASLAYGGVENIEIEKVTGPIKEILYNYHGWRLHEYEFIYQPVSKELEFYYLKMGHPEFSCLSSRKILYNFKIDTFINEDDHLYVVKFPTSEPISISNSAYSDAPKADDVLNRVAEIAKENKKTVRKKKVLTYME